MSPTAPVGPPPTLVLFCGLPGAGKTTLAKRLEAAGRGIRLCTDDWQHDLGIDHADGELHERLQRRLYEHARELLRRGVDVILEDGLWLPDERAAKFADARDDGARIELHVFDVELQELWSRLERRNAAAEPGAYPMTISELRWAWSLFRPPSPAELAAVDAWTVHRGGAPIS